MPSFSSQKSKEKSTSYPRNSKYRHLKGRTYSERRGSAIQGASNRLRQFKQASLVAVAFTGFLILLFNPGEAGYSQSQPVDTLEQHEMTTDNNAEEQAEPATGEEIREATKNEALVTLNSLKVGFFRNLPKILVAIATIFLAWAFVKILRLVLRKTIAGWKTVDAIDALASISIWLLAIGIAVSVLAGDIRALIGSLGLVGLALSWSLQTPIESFTGWLINSFKRYYKIGDRIQVGEVFGDVYKIDFLTTTVWEIGAPFRQGFVMAEQPTGRLVTFPNNEILTGSIVNLTSDFPYVWDELAIAVANESDIVYTMEIVREASKECLSDYMKIPVREYEKILLRAGLSPGINENPQIYVAANDSWTDIIVRYLVGASERRKWKSGLTLKMIEEFNKPQHKEKIKPAYHRRQIQFVHDDEKPEEESHKKRD